MGKIIARSLGLIDPETDEPVPSFDFVSIANQRNGMAEPVQVIGRTVTENGTYEAPPGYAYSPVTVNVEGGNPNYTQVITGTVENPWGDLDVPTLASALLNGGASGVIKIDASSLGFETLTQPLFRFYAGSDIYTYGVIISLHDSSTLANKMSWSDVMGGLDEALLSQNGTVSDLSQYASMIPTTLTIYWHPMPE